MVDHCSNSHVWFELYFMITYHNWGISLEFVKIIYCVYLTRYTVIQEQMHMGTLKRKFGYINPGFIIIRWIAICVDFVGTGEDKIKWGMFIKLNIACQTAAKPRT